MKVSPNPSSSGGSRACFASFGPQLMSNVGQHAGRRSFSIYPVNQMRPRTSTFTALIGLVGAVCAASAAPLSKCTINGTVTYQQGPCPSDQVRKTPTVQDLNAAEKRKREAAASAPSTRASAPTPAVRTGFTCDGRTYCSQMSSCAEAKYFLANCPGTKMDGDRNGVPCEKQWCSR